MAKSQTKRDTKTDSGISYTLFVLMLVNVFLALLACSIDVYHLLDAKGVFDRQSVAIVHYKEAKSSDKVDPVGVALCEQLLSLPRASSPGSGALVNIPDFERCQEASSELFDKALEYTVHRADWLYFRGHEPFHLWWQNRILMSDLTASSDPQSVYIVTDFAADVRGATVMIWGDCEQADYPYTSITTVVIYPCPYLGEETPFRVLIYQYAEPHWFTDGLVYKDELALFHDAGILQHLGRVICPVRQATLAAYGDNEETIEFLCQSYLR